MPANSTLPRTGGDNWVIAGIALLFIIGGLVAMRISARRR